MPFSDENVQQAWSRAGGQCECKRNLMTMIMLDVIKGSFGSIDEFDFNKVGGEDMTHEKDMMYKKVFK